METPGQRTMRQWFQAKLGERLLQAGSMAQSRQLLRRGAMKMQDGTLGQPSDPAKVDDMNISVGDTYYQTNTEESSGQQPGEKSLLAKALPYVLAAALGGGGAALAISMLGDSGTDTDTTRRVEMEKFIP